MFVLHVVVCVHVADEGAPRRVEELHGCGGNAGTPPEREHRAVAKELVETLLLTWPAITKGGAYARARSEHPSSKQLSSEL